MARLQKQLISTMAQDPDVLHVKKSLTKQITNFKINEDPEVQFIEPKYKENLPPSSKWDEELYNKDTGKPTDKFFKVSAKSQNCLLNMVGPRINISRYASKYLISLVFLGMH